MSSTKEGNAIVYCEGAFGTPNGKTAHGLVRFTQRYGVLSVIDSKHAGKDAGEVLDGRSSGISVFGSIDEAVAAARDAGRPATHLVVGLAPDGGRLEPSARKDVLRALQSGLNVDCGLHDFLSEDTEMASAAEKNGGQDKGRPQTAAAGEAAFLQRKDRGGQMPQGRCPRYRFRNRQAYDRMDPGPGSEDGRLSRRDGRYGSDRLDAGGEILDNARLAYQ